MTRASADGFPRQLARTRQFRLGQPRSFTVSPDGARVVFLRSNGGEDPVHRLWVHNVARGTERCVADPVALGASDADLPPEERARRERVRESAGGIVAYAVDATVRTATFTLGGQLWTCDLTAGSSERVELTGPIVDPRVDPTGRRIAYVRDQGLWVADVRGIEPWRLTPEEPRDVSWGLAEFVAAEEMGRTRGFWWSPDGRRIAVARVDVRRVAQWHIAHPVDPQVAPTVVRYPAAGTTNADVRLAVMSLDGTRVDVEWDRRAFEYLADVGWDKGSPLTLVVQSRDQRVLRVLTADPDTGETQVAHELTDKHWVDLVPGLPAWLPDGRLVAEVAVPGLHVRQVVHVGEDGAIVVASGEDPTALAVWRVGLDEDAEPEPLTPTDGVVDAAGNAGALVLVTRTLARPGTVTSVSGAAGATTIRSCAATPALTARPEMLTLGTSELRAALLLPSGWEPADGPLPVLLDPYGGPHFQRVVRSHNAYLTAQWFAEQGFAVLIADGRGTPGRGAAWDRAVAGDLASPALEDQIEALQAAVAARPDALDPGKVAMRGWSFGGFLAALAVLRRPDAVHAAVAGAPVTEMALYDTHYTERYLGLPQDQPEAYRRSSLLADAPGLSRPLLLIHGLSDDNVVAAHTLRLSRALLEAGRPHVVLPLSGVTHMTSQEAVAENLLLLELDFLRQALDLT